MMIGIVSRLTDQKGFDLIAYIMDELCQDSVQIVVELKGTQRIKQVAFASLWRPWNMIWPAKAMSVSVSADGKNFFWSR